MQRQRHPSGMFDKYLQDDSSSQQYQRYEDESKPDDEDVTDEAEPIKDDPKPGMLPTQHMKMMLTMMEMMQEMMGMFSAMLKSKKPAKKSVEKSEDE